MSVRSHEHGSECDPLLAANDSQTTASSEGTLQSQPNCIDDGSDGDVKSTASGLVPKLAATMFDFFTTGCSMAAIGVRRVLP